MRSSYFISLLMILVVAGAYWYQSTEAVCPAPLSYRIGHIDSSFTIGFDEAKAYIEQAELVWESKVDRELFRYDETAQFTVNFVFDERQEMANYEEAQRAALDERKVENDKVLATVESLQTEYKTLSELYQSRANEYEVALKEYNEEVGKYNDRGGAPPGVFKTLEIKRKDLEDEVKELTNLSNNLNRLVQEVNGLSDQGNLLVDSYNQEVLKYNHEFGFSREFTQGDHQGDEIRIYKFSSGNELVTVLAHEFGHALGVGHVEGESSLMYYLLGDTETVRPLSEQDIAAYLVVCAAEETSGQKIRRTIREFLAKF
ncbi:MAG: matrixin family metalloprotease [Candidatus Pacebacteria bacterium]|nr:matrixin family metalloprotease [Candidatus Paceibacterota bacterium]